MNYVLWLIAGGLLGWITGILTDMNVRKGILLNVVVGSVGALVVGLLLTPLFGISVITQNHFNLPAMLFSLLGAIILLVIFNRFRHDTVS